MTTHHESFSPPYEYEDGTFCPECCDEFFCSRHDEDGPHEQGGDPPVVRESLTNETPNHPQPHNHTMKTYKDFPELTADQYAVLVTNFPEDFKPRHDERLEWALDGMLDSDGTCFCTPPMLHKDSVYINISGHVNAAMLSRLLLRLQRTKMGLMAQMGIERDTGTTPGWCPTSHSDNKLLETSLRAMLLPSGKGER